MIRLSKYNILALLPILLLSCTENKDRKHSLKDFGVTLENENSYTVKYENSRTGDKQKFKTLRLIKNGYEIKMEITSPVKEESAKRLISNKLLILKNLYQPKHTPYKGQFTDIVKCPNQGLPLTRDFTFLKQQNTLFIGGATAKNTLGACMIESIDKISFITSAYIKNRQTLVNMEVFKKVQLSDSKNASSLYSEKQINSAISLIFNNLKLN